MAFNRIKFNNTGLDELIFQSRPKDYGAYMLRKDYSRKLIIGLSAAVIIILLIVSLPLFIKALFPSVPKIIEVELSDNPCYNVQLPEPDARQRCVAPGSRLIYPIVKEHINTGDTTKGNTSAGDTGNTTSNGPSGSSQTGNTSGNGIGNVEVMPSFPGGLERMNEFIRVNINYPRPEQYERRQGVVEIGFTVRSGGELSDVHVIKGVSKGIDEEAIRVIKLMPEWNPGMQKGKPVDNVPVSISITFKL